jgi:hypothetical protein
MPISKDFLHVPASATVGEVLRTFLDRQGQWWWLLTTKIKGQYYICSFGSMLPYLTGRTSHIVHRIGDCPVCLGMDPILWRETGALVEEALADAATCSRLVSDLPMAELPVVEAGTEAYGVTGVTENGLLCGVNIPQVKGDLSGMPAF